MSAQLISGIPVIGVSRYDGRGVVRTSQTHVTNGQYSPVVFRHMGEGAQFVCLTSGLNPRINVVLLNGNAVRDTFGREKFDQVNQGSIVPLVGGVFLYKLVARPSPGGFNGDNQPVVNVAPVEAEGWCELSGGQLCLPNKEQMIHTLTGDRRYKYITATGELFDKDGNRLVHGQIKRLPDGRVVRAEKGDLEYNVATCDVFEKKDGKLRYPNGPFGIRWGGNACLWAAGNLLFGASWINDDLKSFEGSYFSQDYPGGRGKFIGFGVVSAQDLYAV